VVVGWTTGVEGRTPGVAAEGAVVLGSATVVGRDEATFVGDDEDVVGVVTATEDDSGGVIAPDTVGGDVVRGGWLTVGASGARVDDPQPTRKTPGATTATPTCNRMVFRLPRPAVSYRAASQRAGICSLVNVRADRVPGAHERGDDEHRQTVVWTTSPRRSVALLTSVPLRRTNRC
jgi:hypothetical protein